MKNYETAEYVSPEISDQGNLLETTNGADGEKEEDYVVWGNPGVTSFRLPEVDE